MAHPVRPLKTPRPEELSILNAEDGTHFKGVTKMYRGKCLGPETEEKKCGQFCRVQPQGAKISGKLRMGDDLQHCEKKRPLCLREGHRNKAPVGDFRGGLCVPSRARRCSESPLRGSHGTWWSQQHPR